MILVDTSVWLDHMREPDALLERLLAAERVLMHPFVIGEIALGRLRNRAKVLKNLSAFPQVSVAYVNEVVRFIETEQLFGIGIGYVDAHLIVSARLTEGARFWTRDKRLHAAADRLDLAWPEPKPSSTPGASKTLQ